MKIMPFSMDKARADHFGFVYDKLGFKRVALLLS